MRRFLHLAAAVLLTATTAFAQQGPAARPHKTAQERASAKTERMTKELSLTPDQKAKVAELNLALAQQVESARGTEAERATKRAKVRDAMNGYEASLKPILTPDQVQKYDQLKAQRLEKAKAHRGKRKGQQAPNPDYPETND